MSYAARTVLNQVSTAIETAWLIAGSDVTGREIAIHEYRSGDDQAAPSARIEVVIETFTTAKGLPEWRGKIAVLLRVPTRIDRGNDAQSDAALTWVDQIRDGIQSLSHASLQILSCDVQGIESKGVSSIGGTPIAGPWQDDGSETAATIAAEFLLLNASA